MRIRFKERRNTGSVRRTCEIGALFPVVLFFLTATSDVCKAPPMTSRTFRKFDTLYPHRERNSGYLNARLTLSGLILRKAVIKFEVNFETPNCYSLDAARLSYRSLSELKVRCPPPLRSRTRVNLKPIVFTRAGAHARIPEMYERQRRAWKNPMCCTTTMCM